MFQGISRNSVTAEADQAMRQGLPARAAELLSRIASETPDDNAVSLRLAAARRSLGDLNGALVSAMQAVRIAPRDYLGWLMLGSLHDALGAHDRADRTYRYAVRLVPPKSLLPPPVQKQLDHARRRASAYTEWTEAVRAMPDATLSPRLLAFRENILANAAAGPETRSSLVIPDMPSPDFHDPSASAGLLPLAEASSKVRREFEALSAALGADVLPQAAHGDTAHDRRVTGWTMIPLFREGVRTERFASACPVTMALHAGIDHPDLAGISASLSFSVLRGGAVIPPHSGLTNARLIVHWPLIVPPDCGFRVGSTMRPWTIGTPLVFDDTIEHEAWNRSSAERVVLIGDIWHPDLSPAERAALTAMMARPG